MTGILTFQTTTNFGALLQATALQKSISKFGEMSEIINYHCDSIVKRELPSALPLLGLRWFPIYLVKKYILEKKFEKMEEFKNKYCTLSSLEYDRNNIGTAGLHYDRFIVGSDIIWDLDVTGGDTAYYLDFVENEKKKYAFSASFGYDVIPEQYMETTAALIKKFSKISVRETQGSQIIKQLIGTEVPVTADPTLLLSPSEWGKMEAPYHTKNNKYVLVYFNDMDGRIIRFAKKVAKDRGWDVLFITDALRPVRGVRMLRDVSVGQFLWLIHHASCVVTASYHGVLFSINYHVPFYYYNRAHYGRIETIIKQCKITDRNIAGRTGPVDAIDWRDVYKRLQEFKNNSMEILHGMLSMETETNGNDN